MTPTMTQTADHTAAVSALYALLTAAVTAPSDWPFPLDSGAICRALTATEAGEYGQAFDITCTLASTRMTRSERAHFADAIAALYGASKTPAPTVTPLLTGPGLDLPLALLVDTFGTINVSGDLLHRPIAAQDLATRF